MALPGLEGRGAQGKANSSLSVHVAFPCLAWGLSSPSLAPPSLPLRRHVGQKEGFFAGFFFSPAAVKRRWMEDGRPFCCRISASSGQ